MSRQSGEWSSCLGNPRARSSPVSFVDRLAASEGFKTLFREGMALVEEAAAYLDGPGREESRALARPIALAYASESMRLTTRLMQIASWLLLQRAVNEGDMTPAQALSDRHRVKLSFQGLACGADVFEQLPPALRSLGAKSLRVQARVLHLDKLLAAARAEPRLAPPSLIASQMAMLRAAFAS